jgi:hypothetical protein
MSTPTPAPIPLPSASVPGEAWAEPWRLMGGVIIETAEEHIFPAQHAVTGEKAWWHQVRATSASEATAWAEHFQKCMQTPLADFAKLLGHGWVSGAWCYVTALALSEPLEKWKLRRQSTSATSIRMQLMMQTIQLAP